MLFAQEEFVPPPAKNCDSSVYHAYRGIIIVHATLDNYKDTLNFVLDTGSGGISIDSTTSVYLGLTKMSDRTVRGIAGMKTVEFSYNHTLHMPGITVETSTFTSTITTYLPAHTACVSTAL